IAVLLALSLPATELYAYVPSLASPFPAGPAAILVDQITIPGELGTIEEVYQGKSNQFVIFIQDAHVNHSAQKSIASIIQYLTAEHSISLVGQEGGEGEIDTTLLRAFPIQEVKEKVMDRYLRRGEIGGAEYLSITGKEEFNLVGVDERKLYKKNLAQFLAVLDIRPAGLNFVRSARTAMKNLQDTVYSKPHRELNELLARHRAGQINLDAFLAQLQKAAISLNVDATSFQELTCVMKLLADANALSLRAPAGGEAISNPERLFLDIENLTCTLKNKLAESSLEQKLVRLEEYLLLLEHGFNLELSRKDAVRLEALHEEFTHERILSFLTDTSNKHRLKPSLGKAFDLPVDDYCRKIADFYRTAVERDRVLIAKLRKAMRKQNENTAILVTGGFHKEGITKKLREAGISFLLVTPKITEITTHEEYLRIMDRHRTLMNLPERNTLMPLAPESDLFLRADFQTKVLAEMMAETNSPVDLADERIKAFPNGRVATTNDILGRAGIWYRRERVEPAKSLEESRNRLVDVMSTTTRLPKVLTLTESETTRGFGAVGISDPDGPERMIEELARIGDLLSDGAYEDAANAIEGLFDFSIIDTEEATEVFFRYILEHLEHLHLWLWGVGMKHLLTFLKRSPRHSQLIEQFQNMLQDLRTVMGEDSDKKLGWADFLASRRREEDSATPREAAAIASTLKYIQQEGHATIPADRMIVEDVRKKDARLLIHTLIPSIAANERKSMLLAKHIAALIKEAGITDIIFEIDNRWRERLEKEEKKLKRSRKSLLRMIDRFKAGGGINLSPGRVMMIGDEDDPERIILDAFFLHVADTVGREAIQDVHFHFPFLGPKGSVQDKAGIGEASPELMDLLTNEIFPERRKAILFAQGDFAFKERAKTDRGIYGESLYQAIRRINPAWALRTQIYAMIGEHHFTGKKIFLLAAAEQLRPPAPTEIGFTLGVRIDPKTSFSTQPPDVSPFSQRLNPLREVDGAIVFRVFDEPFDDRGISFQPEPTESVEPPVPVVSPEPEGVLVGGGGPADRSSGFGVSEEAAGILPLAEDEIAVTDSQIPKHFVGKGMDLLRKFKERLPDVKTFKGNQIVLGGVTFIRRRTGVHTVWAFKDRDKERVAKHFKLKVRRNIPEIGKDEIAVTEPALEKIFVGTGRTFVKKLMSKLPDPLKTEKETINVRGVLFSRREIRGWIVWAFKSVDIGSVAEKFGLQVRQKDLQEPGTNEIGVTKRSLRAVFVGNGGVLAKLVGSVLPDPKAAKEEHTTFKGIKFYKRVGKNGEINWYFNEKDTQKVADEFGLRLRRDIPELGEDEIAVSQTGLAKWFFGAPYKLARRVNSEIDDSAKSTEDSAIVGGITQ
ncbi:MAG: hypothetical protein HY587_02055, partial [Candidatus Omnitrophica bacterium]|nr:hypothetical protein [Candidatus Omnitrophota bacterium]